MADDKLKKYDMRITGSGASSPQTSNGMHMEPDLTNATGMFAGMRLRKAKRNLEALEEKIEVQTRVLDALVRKHRAGGALLDLDTILETDSLNRKIENIKAQEELKALLRGADRADHAFDQEVGGREQEAQIKAKKILLEELLLQKQIAEQELQLIEIEMKRESMKSAGDTELLKERAALGATRRERYASIYGHFQELDTEIITDRRRYPLFFQWYMARVHAVGGRQQAIILDKHPSVKHVLRYWLRLPAQMRSETMFRNLRGRTVEELQFGAPTIRYRDGIISHDDPPVITSAAYKTKSGFRLVWLCNRDGVTISCVRYRRSIRGTEVFRVTNPSISEPQTWDDQYHDDILYYQFTVADGLLSFPFYCSKLVDKGLSKLDAEAHRVIDEYLRGKKSQEDRETFLRKLRTIGAVRGLTADEIEAVIQAYLGIEEDTSFFDSMQNPDDET